ncbi:hypothetical protein [Streptomyces sp. NBC_00344]|uniref:hypothetical protein n=1 Tax=Streptomyces sp. NBC_00344 TaxID=2975720 RepID=UPI002E1A7638
MSRIFTEASTDPASTVPASTDPAAAAGMLKRLLGHALPGGVEAAAWWLTLAAEAPVPDVVCAGRTADTAVGAVTAVSPAGG